VLVVDGERPDAAALERAVAALASGALIIYPTDTLYALGGLALDARVARAVREAKGRQADRPLPVIVADMDQARGLCAAWPVSAGMLAARFWPGPLTLVLPVGPRVPRDVTAGSEGLALRVPALELARALCRAAGPLISTSANRSGEPPPTTCAEALRGVGSSAALALDAGPGKPAGSTIVDLGCDPPVLRRAGPVAWEDVVAALGFRGAGGT